MPVLTRSVRQLPDLEGWCKLAASKRSDAPLGDGSAGAVLAGASKNLVFYFKLEFTS